MKLKPLKDDEIESIAATAIEDAVDFVEAEITPDRIKAQDYFDGKTELGFEEGRSPGRSHKSARQHSRH